MSRTVVVSNRIPRSATERPAGGLAIALRAALEETGGLWFGWNREIVGTPSELPHVDASGSFTLAGIDLTPGEFAGYYEGEANRALWPLFHNRLDLAHFSQKSLATYLRVNRRFATALAPMLRPDDTIWVHDYHLIPLGLELRRLGVSAPIGFFLHVPFPPHQIFAALPWHDEMIEALSAYDLVGFQAERDLRHFDEVLASMGRLPSGVAPPATGVFPIGIDVDVLADQAASREVSRRVAALRKLSEGCAYVISVDRLDYTKGLIERFEAFQMFVDRHPDWEGRLSLLQIAARSREGISEYQVMRDEVEALVGHINGRSRTVFWTPLKYINRTFLHARLTAYYRFARIGLVTPLCDGMNLVCKEYVAAQDGEDPGVLVLSKFAGAAEQLTDAVLVNPYDRERTAEAIGIALAMPIEERKARWQSLMASLRRSDIHNWRRAFLAALAERGRTRQRTGAITAARSGDAESGTPGQKDRDNDSPLINPAKIDAVLLDLDGVLTETATLHAEAWKETFDAFLKTRARREGTRFRPFDRDDEYRRYVDGKPRRLGVADFLAARGIDLPAGGEDDPAHAETVFGLAKAKNQLFQHKLEEKGVTARPGTRAFLQGARQRGIKLAVVTASRNGPDVVAAAGLGQMIDLLVDGNVAAQEGLAGKPAPDTYLEAARRLGVVPKRAAVIEDALAGIEAGKAGGFGLVIGIAKPARQDALLEAGADAAVVGLGGIDFSGGSASSDPRKPVVLGSGAPAPEAIACLQEIRDRIGQRRLAVFLDYDGTLTPIVERPELAILAPQMREILARLARQTTVCVVSGRKLSDIRDLVKLDGIVYAGAHGFDIRGGAGDRIRQETGRDYTEKIARAAAALRDQLADIPGVLVEDKTYAIAIHYRLVDPDRVPDVEKAVETLLAHSEGLRRTEGKKVFELRPDIDWDKGKAVLWLLNALGLAQQDVLPLYIGDDVTDEDAFRALKGRGLSVFVGDATKATLADFRLADPDQVGRFLGDLANFLEEREK